MWKLLTLLGLVMFLTMLIGGRDGGQVREGLMDVAETAPAVTAAAFDPDKIEPAEAPVELATFVPVAPPALAEPVTVPVAAAPLPESAPVVEAAVAPVADAVPEPVTETPPVLPVRYVDAGSINLRDGPSTGHPVIGKLRRNEAVSVVGDAGDGWVLVRIEGDGAEGYVAARLLTDSAP
ncbi:MAG: SH3 domain-containing protein [Gemmobacter sp.]